MVFILFIGGGGVEFPDLKLSHEIQILLAIKFCWKTRLIHLGMSMVAFVWQQLELNYNEDCMAPWSKMLSGPTHDLKNVCLFVKAIKLLQWVSQKSIFPNPCWKIQGVNLSFN